MEWKVLICKVVCGWLKCRSELPLKTCETAILSSGTKPDFCPSLKLDLCVPSLGTLRCAARVCPVSPTVCQATLRPVKPVSSSPYAYTPRSVLLRARQHGVSAASLGGDASELDLSRNRQSLGKGSAARWHPHYLTCPWE